MALERSAEPPRPLAAAAARGYVSPVSRNIDAELTVPDGPAPPVVGKLFAGRYEIQALLGRGGMGSVYRAFDRAVDEVVALKTLDVQEDDDGAVDRFRRE